MNGVDVAVVGGGAVGAACARACAARGLQVAIFEPGPDPAAASPASAGMLAAQIELTDEALVGLSRSIKGPKGPSPDTLSWRSSVSKFRVFPISLLP